MAETCSLCGTPSCLPCRPLVTPTISRVYVCICACEHANFASTFHFIAHTFLLFPISRSICSDLLVHAHVHVCVRVLSVCVCVCDPSVLLHSLITRCGSGQVEGEENVIKSRECHESCQCQSPPSPSPSSPLLPSSSQTPPSNQDSRGEVLAGQSSPRGDCRQAITSRH